MTKNQIKMKLSDKDRILTISGERKTVIDHSKDNENYESNEKKKMKDNENNEKKEKDKNVVMVNLKYLFSISENADMDSIKAKMENGPCLQIGPYRYREGYDKEFKERVRYIK
ncbi:hypothetical protein U3516DRAFT_868890 [Neocallimastix sp. 'constans']